MAMESQQIRDASFDSTHKLALAGSIAALVFCTISILGRAYSRLFIVESWSEDDTLIIGAWLTTIVSIALFCIDASCDTAVHASGFALSYGGVICYQFGVSLTKVSIISSYLRILPHGKYRLFTWVTLGIVICFSILLIVASGVACSPESGIFSFNTSTNCVPFLPLQYGSAVWNCVADAWLIVFIIPYIIKAQLPQKQNIAIVIVMSAGMLVIVAGIMRVVYVAETMRQPAYEHNTPLFGLWTAIELGVGLFCASAPATLPLLRKLAPRPMASLTGDTTLSNGYSNRTDNLRLRLRDNAIGLHIIRDGPVVTSNAKTGKLGTLLKKKRWYLNESGDNESQEEVFSNFVQVGILKTSEITISETRVESDDDVKGLETRR